MSKTTIVPRLCLAFLFMAVLANARPNVVVILTDDQGWGDLSINGNTNLHTPRIDSLASGGAQFDRFYVCPVCSPTRAEFLTGRYHPRCGVFSTSAGGERIDLDEMTIAQTFKAAGYATGAYGKWHNGMQWPYHPNARGFDDFYGFCSGHWGHYFDWKLEHNNRWVQGKGYINDDFTDHALQFIEKNKDRPFFCYVPYNTPHSPMQVPDRFFKKFDGAEPGMRYRDPKKESLPMTRAALAMVENIDWNVGRILDRLDALKLADNTMVIFFCDNGPNSWRWNGGMRGRKGSTDEGGVRSPFLIRWPQSIKPGRRIPQIASVIDLLPTLADLCGIPVISKKPLDGQSLKPILLGEAKSIPDRMIFSYWRGRVSVRTQQHRLDNKGRLYDMAEDPGQNRNIAALLPEKTAQLAAAAAAWQKEVAGEVPPQASRNRPFPVGFQAYPVTHLPARDGIAHGQVKRSNKFPNASFFSNIRTAEDKITWDVDVATSGIYEAVVYYTCAKSDVGSVVELSLGDSKVRTTVTEAHDPPLVGMAEDRVPRGESYVKDFKPMPLGRLRLKKGRGQLTLWAPEIPGNQSINVRNLKLTLLPGAGQ